MSCEIIQFSAARPVRAVSDKQAHPNALTSHRDKRIAKREAKLLEITTSPENFTETCKNSRLRLSRRDAWWMADRVADYWRARMKWHYALEIAHKYEIGDSASFQQPGDNSQFGLVDRWREAVAKQLLTPAPTLGDVTWKRAKIKSDEFKHLPITLVRAEQAVADDLAFLAAHPTRRSNSEARARTREFKEIMRQRIREIAASRGLSDDEIRLVLGLQHRRVAKFVDKYGVNFEWLYEGKGHPFAENPMKGPREQ